MEYIFFAVVTVVLKNVVGLALALLASNNSMLSGGYMRGIFYLPNFFKYGNHRRDVYHDPCIPPDR